MLHDPASHDLGSAATSAAAPAPDPRALWALDPRIDFLNHGSFGACPRAVLDAQSRLREALEAEPIVFLHRTLEPRLDAARNALAGFLGAQAEDLAFVTNATTGVNTILRSIPFAPGEEIVVTDHEYNATRNAAEAVAAATGARVVVASLPFPISGPEEALRIILDRVGPRTRLVLVDHVTSPTGILLPVERIVRELAGGPDVLVDGAHAPGMLELDLDALGAAYYTGNCHKWICAPKGAGFLHARRDRRDGLRPLVISHGANSTRTDVPRFRLEFDWVGTADPTPWLCVPEALAFMGSLLPGGWRELRDRNRALALEARRILCEALAVEPPAPESMIGSLAAVPLPDGEGEPPAPPLFVDPLQLRLYEEASIEVPVVVFPRWPQRLVRVSAQLYNRPEQYHRLAQALKERLGRD